MPKFTSVGNEVHVGVFDAREYGDLPWSCYGVCVMLETRAGPAFECQDNALVTPNEARKIAGALVKAADRAQAKEEKYRIKHAKAEIRRRARREG